jgi:hypothetical protein
VAPIALRRTPASASRASVCGHVPCVGASGGAATTGSCLVERRVEVSAKQAGELVGLILLNEVTGGGQDL